MNSTGFFYLCTPYRSYLAGVINLKPEERYELAFQAAARFAGKLLDRGVEVFSPIVHSHHVAKHVTAADPSSDYWLQRQRPFLRASRGLIIAKMPGWNCSSGIRWEREFITLEYPTKPIFFLDENFEDLPGGLR